MELVFMMIFAIIFNNGDAVPVIYFADGSCLYANNLVHVNSDIVPFSQEKLIGIDWDNTKIGNESQHVEPYETDSIQYFFSKYIWDKFDLIYDDDGSGEIADLLDSKMRTMQYTCICFISNTHMKEE